eukprot:CAMPEP_0185489324 /NCGR_PEP_ID=MMETSP1366-20130426/13076_1 /TAXON_ID=38817 /ORGANISM="Gephyrocapsa oceanica, Strain RCC1303" /LENGTH=57 /DNA_ID=CAMNT_0028097893 /DNA_START=100 /DNA_END=270 /DNA_ORIENTATION=-
MWCCYSTVRQESGPSDLSSQKRALEGHLPKVGELLSPGVQVSRPGVESVCRTLALLG